MAIYEAVLTSTSLNPTRDTGLLVEFVKVASTAFDRIEEEREKSAIAELKKISRQFIPFATSHSPPATMTGVFFTGDRPCWIVRTDKGGTRIHVSGHHVVQAFTTCSLWESPNDFLMYTDEVLSHSTLSLLLVVGRKHIALMVFARVRVSLNGCLTFNCMTRSLRGLCLVEGAIPTCFLRRRTASSWRRPVARRGSVSSMRKASRHGTLTVNSLGDLRYFHSPTADTSSSFKY